MTEDISYTENAFKESIIHVLKVKKDSVKLKLVLAKDKLSNSVIQHGALFGINAGFFNIDTFIPFLGFNNSEHKSSLVQGLPVINFSEDSVSISEKPQNNFLQTGPLLLKDSVPNNDFSYFKENKHLFDCYINTGKNPRSVFAYDNDFYYLIAVDGRSKLSTGLCLEELTEFLKTLNITNAINLDGGSSSTLILNNKILNNPSGNSALEFGTERLISSAILGFKR